MKLKGILPGLGIAGVSAAPGSPIKNASNEVIDSVMEIESVVKPMDGVCQDILAGEKRYSGTLIPESVMDGQPIDYAKVRFKLNSKVILLTPLAPYRSLIWRLTNLNCKPDKSAFIQLTKVYLG